MKKINLLALGNSLSREEMRNIKGGMEDEEDEGHDKKKCCWSYYCAYSDPKNPYKLCDGWACCSENHQD